MNKRTTIAASVALGTSAVLGLAACSPPGSSTESETLDNGDQSVVDIAVFNGWDEGIAASWLWKSVLEEEGYTVNLKMADVAPVYQGLTTDDYDVVLDTWLPVTHKEYIDQFGDDLTDLGAWNDGAKLAIAVNADAPIDSIEELNENADLFGGTIVGIEPAAGLTSAVENATIPDYGIDDLTLQTSSTAAMLTELKSATDSGENIAVTLWSPHWAYDAFPIKDLEDPKGTLGDAEGIHSFGGKSFTADYPQFAEWLEGFEMDNDRLSSLENAMFNSGVDGSDYTEVVEAWVADNQDYVDGLTS
ncbi:MULTISPECIES: glycine betaine ABC transporter substrate-binding protein [unclassified Frigoribacterium]|uniref:glycine betaine ABC transporter substrate-binding protein n=1 Tax=unclassified Frigoribacterium TaxID=2627005 RepID=UPI0006F8C231|nr:MULTISPECIES: glycine betaine ABC transporter substrate-binding protein [unclassified Frigoribacterium]KQO82508.1 glycine/betaine ABC transporter substrate-binding protein [Frigoribacterium sp. Leaf263]KQR64808.1 glycine/betaine ABC transporter substrate-binding protein [Frigoribacterium sp. Leaf172]